MSVMLNTSVGDVVIDLFVDECPLATKNFLQLCAIKYYNGCLVYNVQQNLLIQSGDPTGTGLGGMSIYGLLKGSQFASFRDEINPSRKLDKAGLVCMAHSGEKEHSNRSQFFITLRGTDMQHMEQRYTVFGEIAEGLETLEKLNNLYCDEENRPFQDVRIKHTYVLDDPFSEDVAVAAIIPPSSPEWTIPATEQVRSRIPYEDSRSTDKFTTTEVRTEAEIDLSIKRKEAQSRAIVLEMTGDLPDADIKPPDEVIFVCKLNPVTRDEDLELIFSRFGPIKSCEIIRDFKTGDSLNYAFVEFETEAAALTAYKKMNNVLIDDRRIKVDFSQSVSKLWNRFLLQPRAKGASSVAVPSTSVAAQSRGRASHDLSRDQREVKLSNGHTINSTVQVATVCPNKQKHEENNRRPSPSSSSPSSSSSQHNSRAKSFDINKNSHQDRVYSIDKSESRYRKKEELRNDDEIKRRDSCNRHDSRTHRSRDRDGHSQKKHCDERGDSRNRSGKSRHCDRSRSRDRYNKYKRSDRHN